ncbi:MAG: hypothetical protein JWL89_722 [Candidatus Saccharibacteria bacterium]|nr:hypothetical protein [Candidatus Saccharibacteria bacterium]
MTSNNCPRASSGFTIIEMMIVLAIAGLIMVITFQAIPTLTRNARNNQRKHDISAILGAVSHYELNHSGNFPGVGSDFLQYTDTSYYDKTVHYIPPSTPPTSTDAGVYVSTNDKGDASSSAPAVTSTNIVIIHKYQKCDTNSSGGSTGVGAGYYDTVALYAIESGSATASQCEKL